jgi:23S rRNA (guanosine2251-2'-O)-methyltransferase
MKGKHRSTRSSDAATGGGGRSNGHGSGHSRSNGHPARANGHAARPNGHAERPREPRSGGGRPQQPQQHQPSGRSMWLYGIHPVLAALANPRRRAVRILMTSDAESTIGARLEVLAQSHPAGLPQPEILARDTIERVLPRGAVHQGVAAQVQGLDDTDIEDICRATEGQDAARVVILDQVTDPHNVGAVIRSAAAFGAAAVILPERNSPGDGGVLAKAASGALERVPLVRVVNLARALDRLKQAGFWCVGLDADASTPINEADLTGKVALVLGAEGEGLRRLTREHCDLMVRIPISKGLESLNVSNAAAITLYELARRTA